MSFLDVTTYIVNILPYFSFCIVLSIILYLIASGVCSEVLFSYISCEKKIKFIVMFYIFVIFPILTFLSFVPTHNRILELKIEKIKNESVTQENLSKGIEEIKRISRKLECRYLGCKKDK